MGFILLIVVGFLVQAFIQFICSSFIANPYYIQLISSLVLAFVFSFFFMNPTKRKTFYKDMSFHFSFCSMAIIFVLFDLITYSLLGY